MNEVYVKQEDGSLKPIEVPSKLSKNAVFYIWLKDQGLSFEEAKFIWEATFIS